MKISKEDFENQFRASIDNALERMAGNPELNVENFFGIVHFLENLTFLSPVIYELMSKQEKDKDRD